MNMCAINDLFQDLKCYSTVMIFQRRDVIVPQGEFSASINLKDSTVIVIYSPSGTEEGHFDYLSRFYIAHCQCTS